MPRATPVVTLVAFAPRILGAPHFDRLSTMVLDGDLKPGDGAAAERIGRRMRKGA
jgi:hypothetical protein